MNFFAIQKSSNQTKNRAISGYGKMGGGGGGGYGKPKYGGEMAGGGYGGGY